MLDAFFRAALFLQKAHSQGLRSLKENWIVQQSQGLQRSG